MIYKVIYYIYDMMIMIMIITNLKNETDLTWSSLFFFSLSSLTTITNVLFSFFSVLVGGSRLLNFGTKKNFSIQLILFIEKIFFESIKLPIKLYNIFVILLVICMISIVGLMIIF